MTEVLHTFSSLSDPPSRLVAYSDPFKNIPFRVEYFDDRRGEWRWLPADDPLRQQMEIKYPKPKKEGNQ